MKQSCLTLKKLRPKRCYKVSITGSSRAYLSSTATNLDNVNLSPEPLGNIAALMRVNSPEVEERTFTTAGSVFSRPIW